MAQCYDISKYVKHLLKSDFLQFRLLSSKDFLKYLHDRAINITGEELEYYDKKGIIRPALRLRLPVVNQYGKKYGAIQTDSFSMHNYYIRSLIEFPQDGDFIPWQCYKDDKEQSVKLYYHPYQLVPLPQLLAGNNIIVTPDYFEKVQDYQKALEEKKEQLTEIIKVTYEASKKWLSKVGLLMLLQEPYGFYAMGSWIYNPEVDPKTFFDRWKMWRLTKFEPESIRVTSGLSIEEIKKFYGELILIAHRIDPLSDWFVLLQLINNARKNKLKKEALLAQDYYRLARMIALFIYELTDEKMLDPDDFLDMRNGEWKRKIYGEPFDYESNQTQKRILDDYLINRLYRIALIYEGDTEDAVIRKIFDALDVDQKTDGVFLFNAFGQGNIKNNLYIFAKLAKANQMRIFLILDHDANWKEIIEDFKRRRYINDDTYRVWNRDFDSDNFTVDEVVDAVNFALEQKSLRHIEKEDAKYKLNNSQAGITKVISNLIYEINGMKLEDVISKRKLGEILIEPRIDKIKMERDAGGWKPLLPIEKDLKRIFNMIPRDIG